MTKEKEYLEKLIPGESKRTMPRPAGSVVVDATGKTKLKKEAKPKPERATGGDR